MREIRTSGLTRGSNGFGESLPLLSTLPSADDDVSAPRATVASFPNFRFPNYEEGEYSGSRGAAEHAEKIQSSSLRALRASA